MNKNFCIVPFVHLNVGPRDEITPCCQYIDHTIDNHGKVFTADTPKASDTLLETWNGSTWEELRKSFLNNERPQACFSCWENERITNDAPESYRTHANYHYTKYLHITEKLKTPIWLQLKLGAKCNLACRMCSEDSSNKWLKEAAIKNIGNEQNIAFKDVKKEDLQKWSAKKQQESAWLYTDTFWDELKSISENLERIEFTGGEPLLITEHFQYLEWCIEQGYAKNIYLDYSTNGTVELTNKIKDIWNNFKYVNVTISMDAYGKLAEYIRTGITWKYSAKNILKYIEYFDTRNIEYQLYARNNDSTHRNIDYGKNANIELAITVSAYNIYYIDELLLWCNAHNIRVDFNMLSTPYELSIKQLPPVAKRKAIKKLNKYTLKHTNIDNSSVTVKQMKSLINFIEPMAQLTTLARTFCTRVKEQEKIYKIAYNKIMDYEKSFPEWWGILNE